MYFLTSKKLFRSLSAKWSSIFNTSSFLIRSFFVVSGKMYPKSAHSLVNAASVDPNS